MKRPWAAAAGTAAATSLLFLVLYHACNQLTRVRPDVGVWAFGWETHWPVVPAMIVPYWSIDLLFVAAPFLAATAADVAWLRRRLTAVIVGGALGFLLVPLRFAFPRPEIDGVFAPWFAALYGFDAPHNLFPSLHIALRTVLAVWYVRRTTGGLRWALHGWFFLIGVSTLLTWQHHLVDVAGGFWLAAIVLHLARDEPAPAEGRNPKMAWAYGLGAVACTQIARLTWPWGLVAIWPAFSLGAAAWAYAGGAWLYRKNDGRLAPATKWLMGPMLAGQWLSWRWYARQAQPWDALAPGVWIGRRLTEAEAAAAVRAGVTAVLDLSSEFSAPASFLACRYRHLAVPDLTAPTSAQLDAAADFVAEAKRNGIVYIHCKAGYSRTAAAAGAWLLRSGAVADADAACRRLAEVRPAIVIRPEIRRALAAYAGRGRAPQR